MSLSGDKGQRVVTAKREDLAGRRGAGEIKLKKAHWLKGYLSRLKREGPLVGRAGGALNGSIHLVNNFKGKERRLGTGGSSKRWKCATRNLQVDSAEVRKGGNKQIGGKIATARRTGVEIRG